MPCMQQVLWVAMRDFISANYLDTRQGYLSEAVLMTMAVRLFV